jgi:hypothetical protein
MFWRHFRPILLVGQSLFVVGNAFFWDSCQNQAEVEADKGLNQVAVEAQTELF